MQLVKGCLSAFGRMWWAKAQHLCVLAAHSQSVSVTSCSYLYMPTLRALILTQDLPQLDSSFQLCNVHWKYCWDYLNWTETLPLSLLRLKPDQFGTSCSEQLLLIQTVSPSQMALQYAMYPQLLPSRGLQHLESLERTKHLVSSISRCCSKKQRNLKAQKKLSTSCHQPNPT